MDYLALLILYTKEQNSTKKHIFFNEEHILVVFYALFGILEYKFNLFACMLKKKVI